MAKRKLAEDLSRIPICSPEFLQDVSIGLGRRLKGLRYMSRGGDLEFRASTEVVEGMDVEKFEATRWLVRGEYVQVDIWSDKKALYVYREPKDHKYERARYIRFWANLGKYSACECAELVRDSLRGGLGFREVWHKLSLGKEIQL